MRQHGQHDGADYRAYEPVRAAHRDVEHGDQAEVEPEVIRRHRRHIRAVQAATHCRDGSTERERAHLHLHDVHAGAGRRSLVVAQCLRRKPEAGSFKPREHRDHQHGDDEDLHPVGEHRDAAKAERAGRPEDLRAGRNVQREVVEEHTHHFAEGHRGERQVDAADAQAGVAEDHADQRAQCCGRGQGDCERQAVERHDDAGDVGADRPEAHLRQRKLAHHESRINRQCENDVEAAGFGDAECKVHDVSRAPRRRAGTVLAAAPRAPRRG